MEGGEVKEEEKLPAGFRFHPTDEELITCYLMNKISDANFTGRAIGDVDLNKCEPWDLPGKAKMGEKEWYFFSIRDRKYPTGIRTNRATNTGYWKTTGKDKEIYNSDTSELVGMKKTLVFYGGRAPRGEKTNWVMHEYRIHSKSAFRNSKQDEWVVCRVFQKSVGAKKYPNPNHSSVRPPTTINPCTTYNLDQFPQNPIQSQHTIHHRHHHPLDIINSLQFPAGIRSHLTPSEIQELSRLLMISSNTSISSSSSSGMTSLPIPPPQPNYGDVGPGGGNGIFTISGLNLNLSAALQQPPSGWMHDRQQGAGYGVGMNSNNRFMVMEQCGDLEHYWPSY